MQSKLVNMFCQAMHDGKTATEAKNIQLHFCALCPEYFPAYENIYNEYYGNGARFEQGEEYIAPMYNLMIKKKYDVYIQSISSEKVHVLGTPEEVVQFTSNSIL